MCFIASVVYPPKANEARSSIRTPSLEPLFLFLYFVSPGQLGLKERRAPQFGRF